MTPGSNQPAVAGSVVNRLVRVIGQGELGLDLVPDLMRQVLEHGYWRERQLFDGIPTPDSQLVRFDTFLEFVISRPPEGLGENPTQIERLLKETPDVLTMYREAIAQSKGGDRGNQYTGGKSGNNNNVMIARPVQGNALPYTLRRLKRDHPALFQRVLDKELSAHAAAIEAGFRRPMLQVPADDLDAAIKKLIKHYGKERLLQEIYRA